MGQHEEQALRSGVDRTSADRKGNAGNEQVVPNVPRTRRVRGGRLDGGVVASRRGDDEERAAERRVRDCVGNPERKSQEVAARQKRAE